MILLLPNIYISRRNRGGSFFTMLLFVMMLVSTGLMYYYFQRTRSLERQVISLQNGEAAVSKPGVGFLGMLGLGEKNDDPSQRADPPAVAAVTPATESQPEDPSSAKNLPLTGAASTPRPRPVNTGEVEEPLPPVESNTTRALEMETDEVPSEEEAQIVPIEEPAEESGQKQNLDSLYDAQPPVRVRAPRRNDM